jgi:ABC-type uncharacterized transport system substrate-binding protein
MVFLTFDEAVIKEGFSPAGTCIIWYDLGAQMADKAMKVLAGANPGELGWDYPRKHNLIFNLAMAKQIGMKIPDELMVASYRVYTDFDGHFAGQKN